MQDYLKNAIWFLFGALSMGVGLVLYSCKICYYFCFVPCVVIWYVLLSSIENKKKVMSE